MNPHQQHQVRVLAIQRNVPRLPDPHPGAYTRPLLSST